MNINFRTLCAVFLALLGLPLSYAQTVVEKQQNIADHARKADRFLKEKRPELAIPELESLLALDPKNANAQGNLGVLLFFQGDFAKASPHLRTALEMQPGLARIQGLLGIAEKRTGNIGEARKDLEASFPSLHEQDFKTRVGTELIELYIAGSDLDRAAAIITQLRQADPENMEILYTAYRIHSDLAGESMLELSLVAPDSAQMHQAIAHEEARQGNATSAIAQYRKAIEANAHLPGAHFELAELLRTLGDATFDEEAEREYMAALREYPFDERADCRLGELFAKKGDFAQSYAYFSRAEELRHDNPDALSGVARALIEMGQKNKALPLMERAAQLEPTDPAVHYQLARLYRQQGRIEDAKQELALYDKYKEIKNKLRAIYKELRAHPAGSNLNRPDE